MRRGIVAGLGWLCVLLVPLTAPMTAEVLSAGVWTMPWWAMPLALTLLMAGLLPVLRAASIRGTRWADDVAERLGHRPSPEELAEERRWTPTGLKNDPEDPALFPAKRPGPGTGVTINLANPAGRWLARAFVAVFCLGVPLLVWISAAANR